MLLDQMLDDFSPAELARQRAFYLDFRRRLQRLPARRLDPQMQADYNLLQNAVAFALYSIDQEQFYRWKPQMYSENLGSALFANMSLEYTDKNTRARDLAARLEKDVASDAEQPRQELLGVAHHAEARVRPDEGLLRRFIGGRAIADEVREEAIDRGSVTIVDLSESRGVARACPRGQCGIEDDDARRRQAHQGPLPHGWM